MLLTLAAWVAALEDDDGGRVVGDHFRQLLQKSSVGDRGGQIPIPTDLRGKGEACVRGNASNGDGVYKVGPMAGKTWRNSDCR